VVTEPEIEKVEGTAVAAKATTVTLPPLTVTDWLAGLNVKPALLGVTV
jgi:hypothetical protein